MLIQFSFDEEGSVEGRKQRKTDGVPYHNCGLMIDGGMWISMTPRGLRKIVEEGTRLLAEIEAADAHLPPRPTNREANLDFVKWWDQQRNHRSVTA